jgi:glycosyltransferase involved in cell wall biosynthesis
VVPTIHDAAVYLHSSAYTHLFICWYRFIFRYSAKRAQFIITVSESAAYDLSQYISPPTFRIIPNSAEHILDKTADRTVLDRLNLSNKQFLLAVGSLNPTKNFSALIRTYVESNLANKIPLVIVGSLNKIVFREKLPIAEYPNIFWVGSVSDGELRALYESATVFIFPSLYEGFGIPPLEAMHCGCPVVASNLPSIREVCSDAAQYFDPCNMNNMIYAIEFVLQNNVHRETLVAKGRQRAKYFNWTNSAQRVRSALSEFLLIDK